MSAFLVEAAYAPGAHTFPDNTIDAYWKERHRDIRLASLQERQQCTEEIECPQLASKGYVGFSSYLPLSFMYHTFRSCSLP
ncbi:MAG: hypothetical protein ACREHG_05785, partial [Candidatus Saccharimonadales bacterium]